VVVVGEEEEEEIGRMNLCLVGKMVPFFYFFFSPDCSYGRNGATPSLFFSGAHLCSHVVLRVEADTSAYFG